MANEIEKAAVYYCTHLEMGCNDNNLADKYCCDTADYRGFIAGAKWLLQEGEKIGDHVHADLAKCIIHEYYVAGLKNGIGHILGSLDLIVNGDGGNDK